MRKPLLIAWLLVPAAVAGYHFGPGQDRVRCDDAAAALRLAEAAVADALALTSSGGDAEARPAWEAAEKAFAEALALLPAGSEVEARTLRLERAKAQMLCGQLPDARRGLESLAADLATASGADPAQRASAQDALASARYYTTWLMRLEGASREEWVPEIEGARQSWRLLAEQADARGDTARAAEARENLESAIRLERMALGDLQGLPLPSQ